MCCSCSCVSEFSSIPSCWHSGERKGYPLQYSSMENSMDCIVHGVAKSRTWLSDFPFFFILALVWWISGLVFIEVQTCSTTVWCLVKFQNLLQNDIVTGLLFSHTLVWFMVLKPFHPYKTCSHQQPNSNLLLILFATF